MIFRECQTGKPWRGHRLPVVALDGQQGGASGKVWGLDLGAATPELRALLNLPETPISTDFQASAKSRPDDRNFELAVNKQKILAPILKHPKGSQERSEAFRKAAAEHHRFGADKRTFTTRTLRKWVRAVEAGGAATLVKAGRKDRGSYRVRVSRA